MPILRKVSSAARMAVIYVTAGALIDVWSGTWFLYLLKYPPVRDSTWYWCYGFLLTGVVLMIIGFTIGKIGRSACRAEMTAEEVVQPPPAQATSPPVAQVVVPQQPAPTQPAPPAAPTPAGSPGRRA